MYDGANWQISFGHIFFLGFAWRNKQKTGRRTKLKGEKMRIIEEMCEVQLQDEVTQLRKENAWLREQFLRVSNAIFANDIAWAGAICSVQKQVLGIKEKSNENAV
jgi:hypothetical protein